MATATAIATDPRNISAGSLALIGLANWLLQTYVFHGATPAPVATSLYIILPALVGYLTTHIALNMYPPKQLRELKANFQAAMKSDRPLVVLPNTTEKTLSTAPPSTSSTTPPETNTTPKDVA
jgi:hypothetical protein